MAAKEVRVLDQPACHPLPIHPAEGPWSPTKPFTCSSGGLWPGGFRGESLAEKGPSLLPWRGGADSVCGGRKDRALQSRVRFASTLVRDREG